MATLPEVQHISGDNMQNSNNTINNFPSNFNEFVAPKPPSISMYEWLFHPLNIYRFGFLVAQLLRLIDRLCNLDGKSFAFIPTIAAYLFVSTRTVQRTIRKLTKIGILEETINGNSRRYRINWYLLRDNNSSINNSSNINIIVTPIVTPSIPIIPVHTNNKPLFLEATPDTKEFKNKNKDHQHTDDLTTDNLLSVDLQTKSLPVSDPITEITTTVEETEKITVIATSHNSEQLTKLDPIELEIKTRFEDLTGKTLNIKKNRKPLTELKEIAIQAKEVVILAFKNVADYLAQTNSKIYNLGYILATAKNLLNPKANIPKADTSNLSENRAYSSIGGDLSKYVAVAATPEQRASQLELDKKYLETEERHSKLKDYFFKALPENEQIDLINQKREQLKNDSTLWAKLKGFYPKALVQYCIDKIKDDLLESYLVHQEFLVNNQI